MDEKAIAPHPTGVVLVVLDSMRFDAFDPALDGATPQMAGLAREGTLFTRAIAPAAWTLPSFISMMTGLTPTQHRLQAMSSAKDAILRANRGIKELVDHGRFLPSALGATGVSTFLGSANVWVSPASGFGHAFDEVVYVPFPPRSRSKARDATHDGAAIQSDSMSSLPSGLKKILPVGVKHMGRLVVERISALGRMTPVARWALRRGDKGSDDVIQGFERWVSNQKGAFFALICLIDTHDPHLAPKGWGPADPFAIASTVLSAGRSLARKMNQHNWGYKKMSQREIARLHSAYRAEVRYSDHCIGRIKAILQERDLLETTTLIVTADHGESFGEHGLIGHGVSLGEQVTRVPLIARGPHFTDEEVSEPVSLASLAATIAKIFGTELGSTPALTSDEGKGQARLEVEPPGSYFHSSGVRFKRPPEGMDRPAAAFYDGSWKLIVGSFWREALYDLVTDPEEKDNLIARGYSDALEGMRREWEERTGVARG